MMYYTHVATSVAITSVGAHYLGAPLDVGLMAGVVVGSLMPDIDEPNSKIGRKVPGVSHIIKFLFGHRGITHSLFAAFAVAVLMSIIGAKIGTTVCFGIAMGYLFHILEDFFFGHGVPLFKPFSSRRYGAIGLTVGGIAEKIIFLVMVYLTLDVMLIHYIF